MLPFLIIGIMLAAVVFSYICLISAIRKHYKELRRDKLQTGRFPIILLIIMFVIICIYTGFAVYCGKLVFDALCGYMGG